MLKETLIHSLIADRQTSLHPVHFLPPQVTGGHSRGAEKEHRSEMCCQRTSEGNQNPTYCRQSLHWGSLQPRPGLRWCSACWICLSRPSTLPRGWRQQGYLQHQALSGTQKHQNISPSPSKSLAVTLKDSGSVLSLKNKKGQAESGIWKPLRCSRKNLGTYIKKHWPPNLSFSS